MPIPKDMSEYSLKKLELISERILGEEKTPTSNHFQNTTSIIIMPIKQNERPKR